MPQKPEQVPHLKVHNIVLPRPSSAPNEVASASDAPFALLIKLVSLFNAVT